MKKMKKAAAMLMAATVAAAMPMTAMAASITVDTDKQLHDGEAYRAYKIFDYTSEDESATDNSKVAYTISRDSAWKSIVEEYTYNSKNAFTLTASKNDPNVYVVETNTEITYDDTFAAAFAKYLSDRVPDDASYIEAEDKQFGNLDRGYYFVNTTTGSLCSLVNSDSEQTLKEKNSLPEVDKTADKSTASIGDTITYTITVTDGEGTETPIVVRDIAEAGLDVDVNSIEVKKIVNGVESTITAADDTYSTSTDDDYTFKVTLSKELVEELDARKDADNDKVVITYTAKLNGDAEIYYSLDESKTNDNTVNLTYYNHEIPGNTVGVATYKFDLVKTDMSLKGLTGAEFKLFKSENGTDEVKVIKVSDGLYRVVANDDEEKEAVAIKAGKATVEGLGSETYYLEETVAPAGYNPLTVRQPVTIFNDSLVAADPVNGVYSEDSGVIVKNNHGALLPSTGGIGTTVFYATGIVVMAGAVFFVVRSKKHE